MSREVTRTGARLIGKQKYGACQYISREVKRKMNPIAYDLKPTVPLWFLLIGQMVYYRDGSQPRRRWMLNIYSSARSRQTAAKKMKRQSSDVIFIEWEITMEQIVKQGKYVAVLQSDKVLLSDKLDIFKQVKGKG